jgi:predicted acylesterase/phospholipase RssA
MMENKIGFIRRWNQRNCEAGVLKFLEEKIYSRSIAGTSAGAIVGGLYALGVSK